MQFVGYAEDTNQALNKFYAKFGEDGQVVTKSEDTILMTYNPSRDDMLAYAAIKKQADQPEKKKSSSIMQKRTTKNDGRGLIKGSAKAKEAGRKAAETRRRKKATQSVQPTQGTAHRQAPAVGYTYPEKDEYREQVWSMMAQELNPETARVILFPSKEGYEIATAIKYGFREENLIAVEKDGSMIYQSEWASKCPNVRSMNMHLSEAVDQLNAEGVHVDAINFDSCSNFSAYLLNEVRSIKKLPAGSDLVVGLTMIKGREGAGVLPLLDGLAINDQMPENWDKRMKVTVSNTLLTESPYRYFQPLVTNTYHSPGTTPVLYAMFKLRKNGSAPFKKENKK